MATKAAARDAAAKTLKTAGYACTTLRNGDTHGLCALFTAQLKLEDEAVLSRATTRNITGHGQTEIKTIMDAFAAIADPIELSFRVRPMLRASADEMVLEVAVQRGKRPDRDP